MASTHAQPTEKRDTLALCVCRYVVLNRPWAFVQWLEKAQIKERFVLMSEPDHVWLKPMPNLMDGNKPAAFPFFYIEPSKKDYLPITEKFTGKLTMRQAESIAPIGALRALWCARVTGTKLRAPGQSSPYLFTPKAGICCLL